MQHATPATPNQVAAHQFRRQILIQALEVRAMNTIQQPVHSNHWWNQKAAMDNLKAQGCTKSVLADPELRPDFSVGKPMELAGRRIHLHEVTGEYLYIKIDVVV